jgi:hypothetical protein
MGAGEGAGAEADARGSWSRINSTACPAWVKSSAIAIDAIDDPELKIEYWKFTGIPILFLSSCPEEGEEEGRRDDILF